MDQQQTQGDLEYINDILGRLLEHYFARESLPAKEGHEGERVTMGLLHRLARCVVAEGYGE